MKVLILLFLMSVLTSAHSRQVTVEEAVGHDIKDYDIIAMGQCLPPGYKATAMCIVIKKEEKEYMAIHDIQTKELIELRTTTSRVWHRSWLRT